MSTDDLSPQNVLIATFYRGTRGCVSIDAETHKGGVNKHTRGEAGSAFNWHHSSVYRCQ